VLSSSQSLQIFFQPILRHFLKAAFSPFKSLAEGTFFISPYGVELLSSGIYNVVEFFHLFFLSQTSSSLTFQFYRSLFPLERDRKWLWPKHDGPPLMSAQ
jgi:hypothetical protein